MCVLRIELKFEALNANCVCLFLSWRLTQPLASTADPAVGFIYWFEVCLSSLSEFVLIATTISVPQLPENHFRG